MGNRRRDKCSLLSFLGENPKSAAIDSRYATWHRSFKVEILERTHKGRAPAELDKVRGQLPGLGRLKRDRSRTMGGR